jgi:hypothetical protein
VESESVEMYRLRLRPQSKILTRYSNPRALIATVTVSLILKNRLSQNSSLMIHVVVMKRLVGLPLLMHIELL